MKSRLFGALASSALFLSIAGPAMAADPVSPVIDEGGTTTVSVTVTAGTTLYVPATIDIGAGHPTMFPGQTYNDFDAVDLNGNDGISWWSNEGAKNVKADMGNLVAATTLEEIADSDVSLYTVQGNIGANTVSGDTFVGDFGGAKLVVGDILDPSAAGVGTIETISRQYFYLEVFVPSAINKTYSAELTWSVE